MHLTQKIFVSSVILASCVSVSGCGPDQPAKEIAPGQFVIDEPIQTTVGPLEKSSKCAVDTINGKSPSKQQTWEIHRGEEAVLSGWALSKDRSKAAPQLFIQLTGDVQTYYAVTNSRNPRPDVNQYFRVNETVLTGYELRAKTDQIEPGIYAVTTLQAFTDEVEGCESHNMLIVN